MGGLVTPVNWCVTQIRRVSAMDGLLSERIYSPKPEELPAIDRMADAQAFGQRETGRAPINGAIGGTVSLNNPPVAEAQANTCPDSPRLRRVG